MRNFYCHKAAGSFFSIDEWSKKYDALIASGADMTKPLEELGEVKCDKQCFDCIAIVGERQIETKKLLNGFKSKIYESSSYH